MRLLNKPKFVEGKIDIKLNVSTIEDLWHLYNLIVEGDRVTTKTYRKIQKETATGSGATEKRVLNLEILVETIDFDPLGELRLQGKNQTANEFVKLNSYHTHSIRVETPQDLWVRKFEWDAAAELRLEEACDAEAKADTAAIVLDYGIANVCVITPSIIISKAKIETTIVKKHKANGNARDESITRFFKQIYEAILANIDFSKVQVCLICSPGTIRDEFRAFAQKEADKRLTEAEKVLSAALGAAGNKFLTVKVTNAMAYKTAVQEAMNNPAVLKEMDMTKGREGAKAWEFFQRLITTEPDRCVYTPQYVCEAIHHEAVDRLLVSDDVFRSPLISHRRFFNALCEKARQMGIEVFVLTTQHASGEQLALMGGIAAILKFAVPELDEIEPDNGFLGSDRAQAIVREHHTMVKEGSSVSGA